MRPLVKTPSEESRSGNQERLIKELPAVMLALDLAANALEGRDQAPAPLSHPDHR